MSPSHATWKRSRGRSGAAASAVNPLRYAPLRRIDRYDGGLEVLECGHSMRPRTDLIGETIVAKRRCRECLVAECAAAGHPFDIVRVHARTCRCGAGDDALMHLFHFHAVELSDERVNKLAEAETLHSEAPSKKEHHHWSGRPWEVRTAPEPRSKHYAATRSSSTR